MIINRPFYLIRHGQTYANLQEITCGLLDSLLTQKGMNQAENLGIYISALIKSIKVIYHGSLMRSRQTAECINKKINKEMKEFSDLNEHSFGTWEGLAWNDVLEKLKEGLQPPGGESRSQFINRFKNILNLILSNHSIDSIPMIVAHGGSFFAFGSLFGLEVINIPNCFLCYFEPSRNSNKIMPWKTSFLDYEKKEFIDTNIYYSPEDKNE